MTLHGRQHVSLERDLDIVMVNGLTPWGNNQLIPLGPLREPLSSLARADIIVIHHADLVFINPPILYIVASMAQCFHSIELSANIPVVSILDNQIEVLNKGALICRCLRKILSV